MYSNKPILGNDYEALDDDSEDDYEALDDDSEDDLDAF